MKSAKDDDNFLKPKDLFSNKVENIVTKGEIYHNEALESVCMWGRVQVFPRLIKLTSKSI